MHTLKEDATTRSVGGPDLTSKELKPHGRALSGGQYPAMVLPVSCATL